jgi:hypothetical protein
MKVVWSAAIAYALATAPDGGNMIVILRIIHSARDWAPGRWPR